MAGVPKFANILQFSDYTFNNSSFLKRYFIGLRDTKVFRVFEGLCHYLDPLASLLVGHRLGDVALVTEQFAKHFLGRIDVPVVSIAPGKVEGQYFTLVVDDRVQFKTIEP